MTVDEELEMVEVEKERRRRAKDAAAVPTAPVSDAGKEGRDEELQRRIDARPAYERSFATGAKQGVTFGFGDEIAGAAGAVGNLYGAARDAVTGFGGGPEGVVDTTKRAYREARDAERTRLDESRAAEPLKTGAGQVLSALLVPVGAAAQAPNLGRAVLQGVGTGVLTGAATGAGDAKTLDPQDIVGEMTKGTLLGGLTGGAAPVALQALRAVRPGVASLLAGPLDDASKGADIARLATVKGSTGANIDGLKVARLVEGKVSGTPPVKGGVPEAARIMREYGMAPKASTTTALNEAATKSRELIHEAKRLLLEQADEAGAAVTSQQIAQRLRDRARALLAETDANAKPAAAMMDQADVIASEGKTYSLAEISRKANRTAELAGNWNNATSTEIATEREFVRAMRDVADDAVEGALFGVPPADVSAIVARLRGSPGPAEARALYQELRKAEQVARLVEDQTAENLGRAAGGRAFGLRDAQVAEAGAAAAGAMGLPAAVPAAAAVGTFKALSARGAQATATAKETAGRAAKRLGALTEAAPTAAPARVAGAFNSAIRGASERPMTAKLSPDDQALAADLRRRGMTEDEIASILGLDQRGAALDELR